MSAREAFGAAKVGGSGQQYKNFKIEEGNQAYRIFPPMHSFREQSNGWAVYHKIHFGFSGMDFKDKTKTRVRPFACIEEKDRQTDMIVCSCPECRNMEEHERMATDDEAKYREDMKEKGVLNTVEQDVLLAPLMEAHKKWEKTHNLDKKWYLNVMDQAGDFGVLKIPHKAKQALDKKIKDLLAEDGIDAFDFDSGVYFVFKRSGRGLDTLHEVDVQYEAGSVKGAKQIKFAPLSEEQIERAAKVLPDLTTVVRRLTKEQILLLVDSGGDPQEVDAIFAMNYKGREGSPSRLPPAEVAKAAEPRAEATKPPPAATARFNAEAVTAAKKVQQAAQEAAEAAAAELKEKIAATMVPEDSSVEAELERQLAELRGKRAAAPVLKAAMTEAAPQNPIDPNMAPAKFAAIFPPPRR